MCVLNLHDRNVTFGHFDKTMLRCGKFLLISSLSKGTTHVLLLYSYVTWSRNMRICFVASYDRYHDDQANDDHGDLISLYCGKHRLQENHLAGLPHL